MESMQMVDEILSDGLMDGFDKIERIEAILSAVTGSSNDTETSENTRSSSNKYMCKCQGNKSIFQNEVKVQRKEAACQTFSTGDIVYTRIFFAEEEEQREKLLNTPMKQTIVET
jgi:exonuclease 3'-5' domain-containing protein 1